MGCKDSTTACLCPETAEVAVLWRMGRHRHEIPGLDQTLAGRSRWAQAWILLGRNLPRKRFRQLQETQPCFGLVWFASTDVSHRSPPECGITWGEQCLQSRGVTTLLMTPGPEPTQAGGSENPTMHGLPLGCHTQAQDDGSVLWFLLL